VHEIVRQPASLLHANRDGDGRQQRLCGRQHRPERVQPQRLAEQAHLVQRLALEPPVGLQVLAELAEGRDRRRVLLAHLALLLGRLHLAQLGQPIRRRRRAVGAVRMQRVEYVCCVAPVEEADKARSAGVREGIAGSVVPLVVNLDVHGLLQRLLHALRLLRGRSQH
jgi:hypothetical protein